MKENRVSNEFRQGREATFAALLMELCLCGERIASKWELEIGMIRWELLEFFFVF